MHNHKKTTLTVALICFFTVQLQGASTTVSLIEPDLSVPAMDALDALCTHLPPPGLVPIVVDYYQSLRLVSFEITPDYATTKTSEGVALRLEQKTRQLREPELGLDKPMWNEHAQGMIFGVVKKGFIDRSAPWYPVVKCDGSVILHNCYYIVKGCAYGASRPNWSTQEWKKIPLKHWVRSTAQKSLIETDKACDVEIVGLGPAEGSGSKIVGCVYATQDTEEITRVKALSQELTRRAALQVASKSLQSLLAS